MEKVNLIPRIQHIAPILILALSFLYTSCKKKKTEADLIGHVRDFDNFLRKQNFKYDSMTMLLDALNESFRNSEKKELSYDKWNTSVTYKWNTDSSIVMVVSNKTLAQGFRREIYLHFGDSVMFVHRFSTEPLGLGNTRNYSFLESIYYLEDVGTIKYLARISYRELDLADTIAFRKKPFADLSDNTSHYYSLEVQNSRNILTLN